MIHLYMGDGKGKTTAAIGLAIRFAGSGKRVLILQHLKGTDTAELEILKNIPQITVKRLSKNYGFSFQMREETKQQVKKEHDENLKFAFKESYDMVILDEICAAVNLSLVDENLVKLLMEKDIELVLTGRNPKDYMMRKADYISEIRCIRHPYQKGIAARKGVEF